jgi:hypothetical protein
LTRWDILHAYALTEEDRRQGVKAGRDFFDRCFQGKDALGGLNEALEAPAPESLSIAREALAEARNRNPSLIRTKFDPHMDYPWSWQMVREAQIILNLRGFGPLEEDGSFGTATAAALRGFQEAIGVRPTRELDWESMSLLRNAFLVPGLLQRQAAW